MNMETKVGNHPNGGTYTFLQGPHSRLSELWFAMKVFLEFFRGFKVLHFVGPCVTVFGSARFPDGHKYCQLAYKVGAGLAGLGLTVMTGGGPGIMAAANRGAKEAGGRSVGSNINLPAEQSPNDYMDKWVTFRYFFVRKVLLLKYSYAFIVLPGGAGTMDELFETLTLVQTGIIKNFPIVLMVSEYWQPLINFLNKMVQEGTISAGDLNLIKITDSADEAIDHIRHYVIERDVFGIIRRIGKRA